jgi:hypothetical protein
MHTVLNTPDDGLLKAERVYVAEFYTTKIQGVFDD